MVQASPLIKSVVQEVNRRNWGESVEINLDSPMDAHVVRVSFHSSLPERYGSTTIKRDIREVSHLLGKVKEGRTSYDLMFLLAESMSSPPSLIPGDRIAWGKSEGVRNPVFMLERRIWEEASLPDWVERVDCDYLNIKAEYIPDWVGPGIAKLLCDEDGTVTDDEGLWKLLSDPEVCGGDCVHVVETWEAIIPCYSRIEAERYAEVREHHFPSGWRVRAVSGGGELDKLMGGQYDR